MDKPQKHAKWMKLDTEGHKIHDAIYNTFLEKTNLYRQKAFQSLLHEGKIAIISRTSTMTLVILH